MARDDRFKRVQAAGADFLETARARAEEFLRELSRASEDTSGRAQEALDEVVEGSRRGTEQLVNSIRKEISSQLGLLGVATKADLADLERRLTSGKVSSKAPAKSTATKAATAKKAGTSKAAAHKSEPKKADAPRSPAKRPGANSTAG